MTALMIVFALGLALLAVAFTLRHAAADRRYKTRRKLETAADVCALYGLAALVASALLFLPLAAGA